MTPRDASKTDLPNDAPFPRVGAAVAAGIVIAWVTLTNLVSPHSYTFLAWNYASYFGVVFQLGWTVACGALLAWWFARAPRGIVGVRAAALCVVVIGLIVCASLAIFQTPYPTIAGDGTNGEGTIRGSAEAALLRRRLARVYINILADAIFKADVYVVWRWAEAMIAAGYVALAGWLSCKFASSMFARTGLMLYLVCTPPLIGTYGHYDSYGMALLTQTVFWVLLVGVDRAADTASAIRRGVTCFVAALFAWWTHPIHFLLIAFLVYYLAARILRSKFPAIFSWWLILAGGLVLALGSAVLPLIKFPEYLLNPKIEHGYLPLTGDYLGWFIHSKLMDYWTVTLPGLLLLVWICTRLGRIPQHLRTRDRDSIPLVGAVVAAILASMFCHTTIPFMQGINDEFARTAIATMLLAPTAILFYICIPSAHFGVLFAFGLVTLFLQLPRVLVYGGDAYLDRMQTLYPHDRCGHNTKMSSYVHLGLNMPMYTEALRQRRLAIFEEGVANALPQWEEYRGLNMVYLIAWSYEFGDADRARKSLAAVLQSSPQNLPAVLNSGAMFTHCYKNSGFRTARSDARQLLAHYAQSQQNPVMNQLIEYITRLDEQTNMNRDRYMPDTPLREQRHLNQLLPFKFTGPYLKHWQPDGEQ